jgi:uncharacterized membrane protein YkvA (DUF1232 family)
VRSIIQMNHDETKPSMSSYTDAGFWTKLKQFALKAGRDIVEKALWLYYAAQQPEAPTWAKAVIYGALAYFISPVDAIPDLTPGIGYVDDLGILASAIASVSMYITEDVKQLTQQKMQDWFG